MPRDFTKVFRPPYAAVTLPEDRPAFVVENARAQTVTVWHPDGPDHENVAATADRYRARGWTVRVIERAAA